MKVARRRIAVALFVAVIALYAGVTLLVRRPRLTTIVHGPDGPPTMVLLHGYGSSAQHWMPFTGTIAWRGRFVFPQAAETTVPPDGPTEGRAWWRLGLASHIPAGRSVPDLSATAPAGLKKAAGLVNVLVQSLPDGPVVLGGFSQGAMVASEVAFLSDVRVDALVLLSGTLVDERTWERHFARRRGLPVFISHGRRDVILPFEVADRFRTKLAAAGLNVTWVPFDGGHEIPAGVVDALNAFLMAHRVGSSR